MDWIWPKGHLGRWAKSLCRALLAGPRDTTGKGKHPDNEEQKQGHGGRTRRGGGSLTGGAIPAARSSTGTTNRERTTWGTSFWGQQARLLTERGWRRWVLRGGELARAQLDGRLQRRWWRGRRGRRRNARSDVEEVAREWRPGAAAALRCGKARRGGAWRLDGQRMVSGKRPSAPGRPLQPCGAASTGRRRRRSSGTCVEGGPVGPGVASGGTTTARGDAGVGLRSPSRLWEGGLRRDRDPGRRISATGMRARV
jgi:hypothetical protein